MKVRKGEEQLYEEFWAINYYISGKYDVRSDFEKLNQAISQYEKGPVANRLFYLALPPSVFEDVTILIKNTCMAEK